MVGEQSDCTVFPVFVIFFGQNCYYGATVAAYQQSQEKLAAAEGEIIQCSWECHFRTLSMSSFFTLIAL